jgi:spermidine/putrescine transport system permease protein
MTARRLPWILLVAAVLLFLFTPALLVVLFAFNATDSTSSFGGFSTRWFSAVFSNDEYMQALGNSAIAAFWTALFDVLAGTAAALALTRLPRRYLAVFSSLYLIPVMVPGLMLGVALLVFFSRLDLPLSMTTVVIGHILITLPLVILVIGARLERLDLSVLDAARDLGASGWTAFRRILLPLIAPALAGSALIAIAWSLDEFIVTLFTNGGTPTVPVLIFTLLRRGLDPSVNALAALLLGATMILGVITARLVSLRDLRR